MAAKRRKRKSSRRKVRKGHKMTVAKALMIADSERRAAKYFNEGKWTLATVYGQKADRLRAGKEH